LKESHEKAERKLQEEHATLTRFDNELKELERVIKEKKQAMADADLELTKLQHDIQVLAKEKEDCRCESSDQSRKAIRMDR
jgi:structural maintenance of chromosome 2